MKWKLTPLHSRLMAIGLVLVALALFVGAIAWPTLWLHRRYDNFLADYTDRLARYRRIAAQRPAVEEAIRSAEARDSRKYYLKGNSPTLAAAELQGIVTRIVDAQQGKIMSSQVLPIKEEGKPGSPQKATLSLQLGASIIPLQLILHTIETHEPYLFIDQMTVRAHQGRTYRPAPGVQPEFIVQLTVHAYALPAAAPSPATPTAAPAKGAKP